MHPSQLVYCVGFQLSSFVLSVYIITSFLPLITSLPLDSSPPAHQERRNRQIGPMGNGFGMSMSEAMATSMKGMGGMGMGMAESMAFDAGVRNVNGFPMPYFDASMSMSGSQSANMNNFPTYGR